MTNQTATSAPAAKEKLIGRTTYCHSRSVLRMGKYHDGSIAVRGFHPKTGEPLYTASVCLPDKPQDGCIWVKNWSENDGVLEALIKAGAITLTGKCAIAGYELAFEARLLV